MERITDILSTLLLIIMFLVIVCISGITLIAGYINIIETQKELNKTLDEISESLAEKSGIGDRELTPNEKGFLISLKEASSGVLEASTISFLFQVISIALISVGVYLLQRTHKNLIRAEEEAKGTTEKIDKVGPLLTSGPVSSSITVYFSMAYHDALGLKNGGKGAVETRIIIPDLRDSLTLIRRNLYKMAHGELGIEKTNHDFILDMLYKIKSILVAYKNGVDDLILICQEIEEILSEGQLVEVYESLWEKFSN